MMVYYVDTTLVIWMKNSLAFANFNHGSNLLRSKKKLRVAPWHYRSAAHNSTQQPHSASAMPSHTLLRSTV